MGEIARQHMKVPLAAAISSPAISPKPPSPWTSEIYVTVRTDHHTANSVLNSLRVVGGTFNILQAYVRLGQRFIKSSLSEKTSISNYLQHFLLCYLKTLSVGPSRVWTHALSHASPILN